MSSNANFNPETAAADATSRLRNHIARSAGQHRRAVAKDFAKARADALSPDPYLLSSTPRKAPPPLRLIKPAKPGPECGFGSCSVTPECTGQCAIREADKALQGHYGRLHTQRQEMPPTPHRSKEDQRARARAWRGVLVVAALMALVLAGLARILINHL